MDTLRIQISGNPRPKERPRVVNGHSYTPKNTAAWETEINKQTALQIPSNWKPVTDIIGITMAFRRETRQSVDVDNLVKCVLDAWNKKMFLDDSQVFGIVAVVERGCVDPGISIIMEDINNFRQRYNMATIDLDIQLTDNQKNTLQGIPTIKPKKKNKKHATIK